MPILTKNFSPAASWFMKHLPNINRWVLLAQEGYYFVHVPLAPNLVSEKLRTAGVSFGITRNWLCSTHKAQPRRVQWCIQTYKYRMPSECKLPTIDFPYKSVPELLNNTTAFNASIFQQRLELDTALFHNHCRGGVRICVNYEDPPSPFRNHRKLSWWFSSYKFDKQKRTGHVA